MSRVLYGARYTLIIGLGSTAIACLSGIILGSIAGYFGGWADSIIMRVLDVIQAFPDILLAIALAAILGAGFDKVIIAIGITRMPNYARMMRANILTVRGTEYIEAATSINCTTSRIIIHHVMRSIGCLILWVWKNGSVTLTPMSWMAVAVSVSVLRVRLR